jgi:glycine hydroxymethyltransferase
VTGGTDNHLVLVDLRGKRATGMQAEKALERAGIACGATMSAGIRLGTPAATTRGFGVAQFEQVGEMILEVLAALERAPEGDEHVERAVRARVRDLCNSFPIYSHAEALV